MGLSRCFVDGVSYPANVEWLIWLAPHPHVFVDRHYLLKKKLVVVSKGGGEHVYTLDSEEQWPLAPRFLFLNYTLIHCFDRPQRMDASVWKSVVGHYFCRKDTARRYLKSELQKIEIDRVAAYVETGGELRLAREVICSD